MPGIPPTGVQSNSSFPSQLPDTANNQSSKIRTPEKTEWWRTKSHKILKIEPDTRVVTITTYSQNIFQRMLSRVLKKYVQTISSSPVYLIPPKLLDQFKAGGLSPEQEAQLGNIGVILGFVRAETDSKTHEVGDRTLSHSTLSDENFESSVAEEPIPLSSSNLDLLTPESEPTVVSLPNAQVFEEPTPMQAPVQEAQVQAESPLSAEPSPQAATPVHAEPVSDFFVIQDSFKKDVYVAKSSLTDFSPGIVDSPKIQQKLFEDLRAMFNDKETLAASRDSREMLTKVDNIVSNKRYLRRENNPEDAAMIKDVLGGIKHRSVMKHSRPEYGAYRGFVTLYKGHHDSSEQFDKLMTYSAIFLGTNLGYREVENKEECIKLLKKTMNDALGGLAGKGPYAGDEQGCKAILDNIEKLIVNEKENGFMRRNLTGMEKPGWPNYVEETSAAAAAAIPAQQENVEAEPIGGAQSQIAESAPTPEAVSIPAPKANPHQSWIDAHKPKASAESVSPEAQAAAAERAKAGVDLLTNSNEIGNDFVSRLVAIIRQDGWSNPTRQLKDLRNSVTLGMGMGWKNEIFDQLQACLKATEPLVTDPQNLNSNLFLRDELRAFSAVYFNENLTLSLHSSAIRELDSVQKAAGERLKDLEKYKESLEQRMLGLNEQLNRLKQELEDYLPIAFSEGNKQSMIQSDARMRGRINGQLKELAEDHAHTCKEITNYETLLANIDRVKKENDVFKQADIEAGKVEPKKPQVFGM